MKSGRGLVMIGIAGFLLIAGKGPSAAPPSYTPVASPAALNAAVRSNLKLVRHWLAEKDFVSAAEAARGLAAVVQLYGYQGSAPEWRKRIGALQQAVGRLAGAIDRRSLAACGLATAECDRLLDDLAKNPPAKGTAEPNFKHFGTNKVWMLLLEGAYVDAKRAETAGELEQVSQAIAEEVGVVGRMRSEAKWRNTADEVRNAALRVAQLARDNDMAGARKALKDVYRRCEVCHHREKR